MGFSIKSAIGSLTDSLRTSAQSLAQTFTPALGDSGRNRQKVNNLALHTIARNVAPPLASAHAARVEMTAGRQSDGSFVALVHPHDIGIERWSGKSDPQSVARQVWRKAVESLPSNLTAMEKQHFIGELSRQPLLIANADGTTRPLTAKDLGNREFLKRNTYAGSLQVVVDAEIMKKLQTRLIREENARLEQSSPLTEAGAVIATPIVMREPLALPPVTEVGKKLGQAGITAAESLPVSAPLKAGALGQVYTVNRMYDAAHERWADAQTELVLPLEIVASESADNLSQPNADSSSKPRPTQTAEPKRPTAMPIPDAPSGETSIAVRPPQSPTKPKEETETSDVPKPTIGIEDLPQPYTPDASPRETAPNPNSPRPPSKDLTPPIIGTITTFVGKKVAEATTESNLAPNGVEKIIKREWSAEDYSRWFNTLPSKRTPTNSPEDIYEIFQTGEFNYQISGGGEKYWADGIHNSSVLDAKFIVSPERSPAIKGSKFPEFLRPKIEEKWIRSELFRANKILRDESNPLTSMRIITNDERAVPYFQNLMKEYGVPGEVVVEK